MSVLGDNPGFDGITIICTTPLDFILRLMGHHA